MRRHSSHPSLSELEFVEVLAMLHLAPLIQFLLNFHREVVLKGKLVRRRIGLVAQEVPQDALIATQRLLRGVEELVGDFTLSIAQRGAPQG